MDDASPVVGLEAAIKIDHAADEARVEDADAAVIEEIDPPRLPALGEHRVIAEVRIAVDDSRMAERVPPGLEHGDRQPVADLDRGLGKLQDLLPLQPFERQKPSGGELRVNP